ncbi:hypothetical protein K0504_12295 [Neiella marina]|uniref:Uncharacterized protein n=1 Tax=Neiella holothuriorum TaxID=2870530 RepID=A0ABS7EHJ8_9GAMM|nr:hypothetical protein [Neiella holothuriorum]MBW8191817.1 hypothetical protein [Neiella holothuriorum]
MAKLTLQISEAAKPELLLPDIAATFFQAAEVHALSAQMFNIDTGANDIRARVSAERGISVTV